MKQKEQNKRTIDNQTRPFFVPKGLNTEISKHYITLVKISFF